MSANLHLFTLNPMAGRQRIPHAQIRRSPGQA